MTVPSAAPDGNDVDARERETLLRVHEVAAAWFRGQLETPSGTRARDQLRARA